MGRGWARDSTHLIQMARAVPMGISKHHPDCRQAQFYSRLDQETLLQGPWGAGPWQVDSIWVTDGYCRQREGGGQRWECICFTCVGREFFVPGAKRVVHDKVIRLGRQRRVVKRVTVTVTMTMATVLAATTSWLIIVARHGTKHFHALKYPILRAPLVSRYDLVSVYSGKTEAQKSK